MSYQTQYENGLHDYQQMIQEYQEMVENPQYFEILNTMPFQFLEAAQLCEKLKLYSVLEQKPRMHFTYAEEAILFYKKLCTFKSTSDTLLENASYIIELNKKVEAINHFVMGNPYLANQKELYISQNEDLVKIARRCLEEIPQYPKMMTKEFRWNFIESVIYSLPISEIDKLVECNLIKGKDIDHISLTEVKNNYQAKITHLCAITGHTQPIIASYELKLKGVTFPNADGSSRQENLIALKNYVDEHPNEEIILTTESYTYHPEIGEPEPAMRIFWKEKEIGNIPRVAAEELQQKYDNPQCTATLKNVTAASEKIVAGCTIMLGVIAPQYADLSQNHTPDMIEIA